MTRLVAVLVLSGLVAAGCSTRNDEAGSDRTATEGAADDDLLLDTGDGAAAGPSPPAAAPAPENATAPAAEAAPAAPAAAAPVPAPAKAPSPAKAPAAAGSKAPAPAGGGSAKAPAPAAGASPAPAPAGGSTAAPAPDSGPAAAGAPAPSPQAAIAKAVTSKGQGISDTTIKIGGTFPMSGITASFGQEGSGAIDAYVKLVNARGGIHGRKLQYISYDDAFDPAQTLANVKRLWEQDKVALIFAFLVDSPNEYVTKNNIPFFTFGGNVRAFSSKYPTVFPAGSAFIGWNAQLAQGVTRNFNFKPKKVAVLTDTEALNTHETAKFIESYWKAAGAEEVFIDPLNLSQGDCSSLVLKYRQAGVEFWDFQSFAFLLCIAAEDRLGWKPKLQGGPVASMGPISSQAGPSMEGVIAGSPGDLADGRPRFNAPQAAHTEYLDALRRFQPKLANVDDANSPATVAMYMSAVYALKALEGAGNEYGELSGDSVLKWVYEKGFNVDVGIGPPIIGYKKGCKNGNEATWYGTWKWDPKRQVVVNNGPVTPQQISPKFWTEDPCFLTGIADELVLGQKWAGLPMSAPNAARAAMASSDTVTPRPAAWRPGAPAARRQGGRADAWRRSAPSVL